MSNSESNSESQDITPDIIPSLVDAMLTNSRDHAIKIVQLLIDQGHTYADDLERLGDDVNALRSYLKIIEAIQKVQSS